MKGSTVPILFGLMLAHAAAFAQGKTFTVSGNVRDGDDGEDLIGVSIAVMQAGSRGAATNAYGFYSISLPEGKYTLRFSYIGYAAREVAVDLAADSRLDVALKAEAKQLEEVVVSARSRKANVSSPEMGVDRISVATVKKIPVLMGEGDLRAHHHRYHAARGNGFPFVGLL